MSTAPTRRLILFRHAKAEQPGPGQPDADRPLTRRGLLDAGAGGQELARIGVPDVVVCSPTRRTRQTWRAALEGLTGQLRALAAEQEDGVAPAAPHPQTSYPQSLYQASVFDIVEAVRKAGGDAEVVAVVGHEPTLSEAALALAGAGSDAEALKHLRSGFSTAAIAVLAVEQEWSALAPGDGRLEEFVVPRAEGGGSIG